MKKIYLLRHFKVIDGCDKRVFNSHEIDVWVDRYDTFDLDFFGVELPHIDEVFTSELSRAKRSAQYLNLTYKSTDLLNEVSAKAFIDTKFKFPKMLWLLIGRMYWSFGWVKRSEKREETYERAKEVVDLLLKSNSKSIMTISHGFFMHIIAKELKKRGFNGIIDNHPKNGKIYMFSNDSLT